MRPLMKAAAMAVIAVATWPLASAWAQTGGETPQAAPAAPAPSSPTGEAATTPPAAEAPEAPATYGTRRLLLLEEPGEYEDPKAFTLSFSGGGGMLSGDVDTEDGTITLAETFSSVLPSFRLMVGRQFFNQLQLELDVGLTNTSENFLAADGGRRSGEVGNLLVIPASLGLTYRFDYFREQPVVPFLSAGLRGAYVNLSTDDSSSTDDSTDETSDSSSSDEVSDECSDPGAASFSECAWHRVGFYAGGGLEILLDSFEPARAADLELSSGINDTYLVLDVRYQWMNRYFDGLELKSDDNVKLDGFQVTAGLKFDF